MKMKNELDGQVKFVVPGCREAKYKNGFDFL